MLMLVLWRQWITQIASGLYATTLALVDAGMRYLNAWPVRFIKNIAGVVRKDGFVLEPNHSVPLCG